MKTYAEWEGNLGDYLQLGDEVDEEMVDHFLNVLPPACWTSNIIQIGEPYSADSEGRNTYPTLEQFSGKWYYRGHCRRGETRNVMDLLDRAEMERN